MEIYGAGQDVTQTIQFVDGDDQPITGNSASYMVIDEAESVIIASTAAPGSFPASNAEITVPAVSNALSAGARKNMRTIIVTVNTDNGVFFVRQSYMIEGHTKLAIMENSFMTQGQMEMLALESMELLDTWSMNTEAQKVPALIQAFERLCKIRYRIPYEDGRDFAGYNLNGWSGSEQIIDNIANYSADEFTTLDPDFIKALRRAQLTEAWIILDGDPLGDHRRAGVMSQTVGESSQFFRPAKPIESVVSKQAMRCLTGYINTTMIARR